MIEWYNEKLLPRGLPELIYQICPRRVSPLKIIVNRRKSEESICGSVKKATKPHFHIELYPTVIFQDNQTYGQTVKWGVRSFRYWVIPLEVTLHEIGHCLHIVGLLKIPSRDEEEMANLWAFQKMEVIGRRNPRLGQPDGFIGGLPGAYIIRKRAQKLDFSQGPRATFNFDDYRAYKCGGQYG